MEYLNPILAVAFVLCFMIAVVIRLSPALCRRLSVSLYVRAECLEASRKAYQVTKEAHQNLVDQVKGESMGIPTLEQALQ